MEMTSMSTQDTPAKRVEQAHGILLTDLATTTVAGLLAEEDRDDLRLRVIAQSGGCSGLMYQLLFDEQLIDGDLIRSYGDGVEVVVDRQSAPLLDGAIIDFADMGGRQGFTIDNPNVGSGCSCSSGGGHEDSDHDSCGCGGGGCSS
jgi:iron-sulfur cluster assembly accessory protein